MYKIYVDVLFLPSMKMRNYIPIKMHMPVYELPPGLLGKKSLKIKPLGSSTKFLLILYVGGMGNLYEMETLFEAVKESDRIHLNIVTRENDWQKIKKKYEKYICSRIHVHFKTNLELEPYYKKANIGSIFVKPQPYWSFVMPVKLFEYLDYGIPIISSEGTGVSHFVQKNNIGWSIKYDKIELKKLLDSLLNNQSLIQEKKKNIIKIRSKHTWENRAQSVIKLLSNNTNPADSFPPQKKEYIGT